jgi:hypothetical protein
MTVRDAYDLGLDPLDLQLCLDMEANRPACSVPPQQRDLSAIQGDLPRNHGAAFLVDNCAEQQLLDCGQGGESVPRPPNAKV